MEVGSLMTGPLTTWTSDELSRIGNAEEMEISTLRRDGTLRRPVIIWVVRLGNDLYVRSVKGRTRGWFPGTLSQHAGRIQAGGVVKDVAFVEESDKNLDAQIDAAYQAKYLRYPSAVSHVNNPTARAATIKLVPRG
jgi:hypothetical protein